MTHRALLFRPPLAVAAIVALGLLTPFAQAQDQPYQGPGAIPDPGTYAGSRQIQEQQQQQDQQFRDQQQPQYNQQPQQGQQQYYGSQGGEAGDEMPSGPWAAMYVDPANPTIGKTSFNFPSASTARAAAMGACYRAAGVPCKEALEFSNACGVRAISRSGVWAARVAKSAAAAQALAVQACQKASGQPCTPRQATCSPNND